MSEGARQSRGMSLFEAVANVLVGFLLALAAQLILFPRCGIATSFRTNLAISAFFTILSIIRSFLLRRIFERL
jgi:hypothetical protein